MRPLLRPAVMLALVLICGVLGLVRIERASNGPAGGVRAAAPGDGGLTGGASSSAAAAERDSFGDGFPDSARIVRPEDRATFLRWLTYLAESQYYSPSPEAASEIHDCAGLIRFAFRNALMLHDSAWRRAILTGQAAGAENFRGGPDFGDLREFTYPNWALGPDLFRTRAGPLAPGDLSGGAFAQFADVGALLHYNTFFVSRDVRAARPGDLLFYYQPGQSEAYHSMLFVGRSYFQPQSADWVVYHTGDIDGGPGQIRELEVQSLMQHPDPRWRPLAANPRFLGVYRFEILR
jgi:uncharacterized protein